MVQYLHLRILEFPLTYKVKNWVCLKIGYPNTHWIIIMFPLKELAISGYFPFADTSNWIL